MSEDDIEKFVMEQIRKMLSRGTDGNNSQIDVGKNLISDLGFDSMEVLNLIMLIEEKFQISIPDDLLQIKNFDTALSIIQIVERTKEIS